MREQLNSPSRGQAKIALTLAILPRLFIGWIKKASPGALDEKGELACKGEPAEVAFSRRENMVFANFHEQAQPLPHENLSPRLCQSIFFL